MKYCISDIHGCLKTFKSLLNQINFSKRDTLYILGDMIDRGSDSAELIQFIIDKRAAGYKINCILGNHELCMLQATYIQNITNVYGFDRDAGDLWRQNGGDKTLDSYGVNDRHRFWQEIPVSHRNFFETLPYYIKLPDYILVHAGLKFGSNRDDKMIELMYGINCPPITNPLKQTSEHDMVWLRDFKVNPELMGKRTLVTGHTPLPLFDSIWPMRDESEKTRHIMIDGGCHYTDHKDKGYGYLVALRLNDKELFWAENCE